MPRIDHAALWVSDLETARDFYTRWFAARANGLYTNPRTGLRTYILTFDDASAEGGRERGARLELMSRPDVIERAPGEVLGWAHLSIALPARQDVDRLAASMAQAGVPLIDGPRLTGDGYYEAVVLDPEGNRVELLAGDYPQTTALRPGS